MKLLISLYRFVLFLLVSWFIYTSSFITFFFLIGGFNISYNHLIGWLNYIYLFEGSNLAPLQVIYTLLLRPLYDINIFLLIAVVLILLLINGTAAYLWCRAQTPLRAAILATTGGAAGQCGYFALMDFKVWIVSLAITAAFYISLAWANAFRKKYFPWLSLPLALEWREPGLVPPLKTLIEFIIRMFNKIKGED